MIHPPRLTFLFENSLVIRFVGPERLIGRLDLAPGMRVLDAGCGLGRLTVPPARAVRSGAATQPVACSRASLRVVSAERKGRTRGRSRAS